jgi:hypothetical protein
MSRPTFVVGTGRCGSTMLSNMLRDHPGVLSLSEFFSTVTEGGRRGECFSQLPIDGPHFWSIISERAPVLRFCLRHNVRYEECLYPCDDPSARFSRQTGVPGIMATTLPHLTDDHDRLLDLIGTLVANWRPAPIRDHYKRLFGWLASRFGRRLWIERSGASLGMVALLLQLFPDARFVHMIRDGRDAAISMHRHEGFQLLYVINMLQAYLGVDPLTSDDRSQLERVPADLRHFLPETFDIEHLRALPVSLSTWGASWSQQIVEGLPLFKGMPADRLLTLRYEDLVSDPTRQLDLLAQFLGDEFVDEDWSVRCAATVRTPKSTWCDLPEGEAHALTEACRPGFERLRELGVGYDL